MLVSNDKILPLRNYKKEHIWLKHHRLLSKFILTTSKDRWPKKCKITIVTLQQHAMG